MVYQGFSESFLKNIIKNGDGEDINVGSEDLYDVVGFDRKEVTKHLLGKSDSHSVKDITFNFKMAGGKTKALKADTVKQIMKKFATTAALLYHPDKTGGDEDLREKFDKVPPARKILENERARKSYDKVYSAEIVNDTATNDFKDKVKRRLKDLSKKTEPLGGGILGEGDGGLSSGVDISSYSYLFPKDSFLDDELNKLTSKKLINRFANWVIYVYGRIRPIEDELKGRGNVNKTRAIAEHELGVYQNFKKEAWKKIKSMKEVDEYFDKINEKIGEIMTSGDGGGGAGTEEAAHLYNLNLLRKIDGWDSLSGEGTDPMSEKGIFAQGTPKSFSKPSGAPQGIRSIHQTDKDHYLYKDILKKAKIFIRYKKKVSQEVLNLESKKDWGKLLPATKTYLKNMLLRLGELERVTEGTYTYTKMKFDDVTIFPEKGFADKVNEIFKKADEEIARVSGKGGTGGSGSKTKTDQARNAAIQIVKSLLSKIKADWNVELSLEKGKWEDKYKNTNDITQINTYKNQDLDKLSRWVAVKEIVAKLASNNLQISFLGVNNASDLTAVFKGFQGGDIDKKKREFVDKIKDYVDDQKKNKDKKIQAAKDLVKDALQNAGLKSRVKEVLGSDWENEFLGLIDDSEISQVTNKLIQKISAFVDQKKVAIDTAISQIKKLLKDSGLTESILGNNWKDGFKGKNQQEINEEVERLSKLIMAENQKDGEDGKKKNDKITVENRDFVLKQVEEELKSGHQKLALEKKDLPVSLFVPFKSLEEKLNSLDKPEDITAFNNKLLNTIAQKKKEKLGVIAQQAIAEIDQMIGGDNSLELGELKNYKSILISSNDPDDIERKKNNIKKLITEQKQVDEGDEGIEIVPQKPTKPSPNTKPQTSLPKMIGITTLILLPLIVIALIVLRVRQKLGPKRIG